MTIAHPNPHYWPSDCCSELIRQDSAFYLKLSNEGLLRALAAMESSGRHYRKFLGQFPEVLCEPLERFYLSRTAIAKLDVDMLKDLLFASSWREANWGAWLAALAPNPAYLEHLELRRPTLPHGTRVIDLAKSSCGGSMPSELQEHLDLLAKIREMLAQLPSIRLPLRLYPNDDQQRLWQMEAQVVARVYRSNGLHLAKDQMLKGFIGYYGQSYKEWLVNGALPAPSTSEVIRPFEITDKGNQYLGLRR